MGLTDKHLAYGDDIPQTQTEKDYYWKINYQQSCDDCISRQEAINCVTSNEFRYKIVEDIKTLPSVTPKEKTGHWVKTPKAVMGEGYMWYCDKCGHQVYQDTSRPYPSEKYCPDCGCHMIEPQESEVRNDTDK